MRPALVPALAAIGAGMPSASGVSAPSDACDDALTAGTAPALATAVTQLRPPDHALRDVGLSFTATMQCEGRAALHLAVWSDEPDEDQTGDGTHPADARIEAHELFLRSERKGDADGRVYLLIGTATSGRGVSHVVCRTVTVAQGVSPQAQSDVRAQAAAAESACAQQQGAPPGFVLLAEGTFAAANQAPLVGAGPDRTVDFGSEVELIGEVSDDGQPAGVLSIVWAQVSGPGTATFSAPDSPRTIVGFSAAGIYVLRLTGSDSQLEAQDDVTVIVQAGNQAPVVDAGPDASLVAPELTLPLTGSVTDDGRPTGALLIQWSQVGGPAAVSFGDSNRESTTVSFPTSGVYVLRLAADDSELSSHDEVTITVHPEPPPVLAVEDVTAVEGQEGVTGAAVTLSLSKPWTRPVTADYVTSDGTATSGCDYRTRYGTVRLEPGQVAASVLVPIVGELLPEGPESIVLRVGNVTEAVLQRSEATISIQDDDGENRAPSVPAGRAPPDGASGISSPVSLSWTATDPDNDPLTHDVYFGTGFGSAGQSWVRSCPTSAGPPVLSGAASAHDEAGDRLFVFGGTGDEAVWILEHATQAGGVPRWVSVPAPGGPASVESVAFYDAAANRLVVHGGCLDPACTAASADLWALSSADGSGGTPTWARVATGGVTPAARRGHAGALDPATGSLIVFGGLDGSGQEKNDTWVLRDAMSTAPRWEPLSPAGPAPAPRQGASAVYDAARNRLIVFGGRDAARAHGDVWVLSNANGTGGPPAWTRLIPVGTGPAPRSGHAAAFDPVSRRLLVFGGTTNGVATSRNFVFNDAWMLREDVEPPAWERVTPAGGPVTGRFAAASAYSPGANRLVVAGGTNNRSTTAMAADTWVLADAMGSLPLVSAAQLDSTYAADLLPGAMHYWRAVSRDGQGAWRGSPAWSLTTNRAPTVDAGPDQTVELPGPAALAAAVADDGLPGGGPPQVTWTKVSGPGDVVFEEAAAEATSASFSAPGAYVVRLTASDGMLAGSDDVDVTVNERPPTNAPPFVEAGPDLVLTLGETATLVGSVTDDGQSQGSAVTVAWSVLEAPAQVTFGDPFRATTTVSFGAVGEYELRLTASDGLAQAFDDVRISVKARADLAVSALAAATTYDGQGPSIDGTIDVTVANLGPGPALRASAVLVFEDRDRDGAWDPLADVELGTAAIPELAPGATATVSVPVAGAVLFAGNVIHAFADHADVIDEGSEANNYGSTIPPCVFRPPAAFTPAIEWKWKPVVLPAFNQVASAPVVADLDGNGSPEVLFVSYYANTAAVLRALDGRDGREVFTVTDSSLWAYWATHLAVGDIDHDGRPEILAVHLDNRRIMAFEHDGRLKWISPSLETIGYGGASLADLDGDGTPEISVGRQVLNADGTLRWTGTGGRADEHGQITAIADLDLDGRPEIVAGTTAYRADGSVFWTFSGPAVTGYNAIANFDADPQPEVVLVNSGRVWLLEHTGQVKWGPVSLPGGGRGGPPTVADVDGDGQPEIGVAGASRYVVLEPNGMIRWAAPTVDLSSHVTGSTVFDFEGDGRAEIVYADEQFLRVFDGSTGAVVYQVENRSWTALEYPVVADVDADGAAEIVASANHYDNVDVGVRVFGTAGDRWVATRRLWNQHSYHITNVDDDLTIPARERNNWEVFNNYRQNRLPRGCEFGRPDLVASFVRTASAGTGLLLTVRVGNAGSLFAGASTPVSFYDGDPSAGGRLLGTVRTATALDTGAFEDVTLAVPATTTALPLWVVADDLGNGEGIRTETEESNNAYESRVFLTPSPNQAPQVDAGPDQELELPDGNAVLDAMASDDGLPIGRIQYRWGLVSGPAPASFADPTAEDTTVSFTVAGTYVLRLVVSDGDLSSADEVTVIVAPRNLPPSVDAGPDQTLSAWRGTLTGSVADDGLPEGGTLAVAWSQVSGPAPATFTAPDAVQTEVAFLADGVYVLALAASDGRDSGRDEVTIIVARQNLTPVVDAGPDVSVTLPANVVALEGVVTDDGLPEGAVVAFTWSVVSSPGPVRLGDRAALRTTAEVTAPGAYVLRLTATDGAAAAADDVTVTVLPAPPSGPAPEVVISSPVDGQAVTDRIEVRGTATSGALAAWVIESRRAGDDTWARFGAGTSGVVDGVLATFDPTMLLNGVHEVRVTIIDTAARKAQQSVHVVVKDNLKVGHFTVSFVDLEVPVAGVPIRIARTYDSRDKREGDFGFGWRLDVSSVQVQETTTPGLGWQGTSSGGFFPAYCLHPTRPHVVTVSLPGGQVGEFEMTTSSQCQPFVPPDVVQVQFRPRPGTVGTLAPVGDEEAWLVGSWPGVQEMYSSVDFGLYDPALYEYTTPDGRKHLIHQVDGLRRMSDLNGNSLQVTRDGITHSSGKGVVFERDVQGRIERITDPAGQALRYGYDEAGDLVSATDRTANTTTFSYDAAFPHHLKEIRDPLGRAPIRNEYFDDGRIKSHTDAFGKTILYAHDLSARQEVVTDRNGAVRVLGYDTRGNVVREVQPDGKVVLRTFDDRNNRRSETVPHDPATTPDPPKTLYVYDDQDNLRVVTDPEGNTTEYTYNARQQVETTRDGRGKTTRNTYDSATGNLLSTTDAMQNVTSYTYDARGNVQTQTATVHGQALVTTYEYDASGNLRAEIDPTGHATEYTYDPNGNRRTQTTTRTLPDGRIETLVTTYEYDANGRLTKTIDPDGTSTRTVYDEFGRQKETYDKLDRRTAYEYDAMGRLLKTTFPDLTYEESTYDNEGRRLTSRDREGRVTRYEYDAMGRLRKTIFPDESFTENVYDDAGRLVESWDARRRKSAYGYDHAGRRTSVRDPLGHQTTFTYDANGNQETVKDARGHTTRFEYDELNRRRKTIFPDETYTETTYDEVGRRTSERDQAGKVTRFEYDALGRLRKVIDARSQETTYGYDELGNRTSQTDANGHVTRFEYDPLGREIARVLPGGARETKTYWPTGALRTRTDFMGRTTSYEYDASDRLRQRTYPSGPPVSFTYTASGRRETVTDGRGTRSYTYDSRGRLKAMTYPDGLRLEYDWDPSGNRTLLRAVMGGLTLDTTFSYDDANRLDVVTDPAGRAYDHGYDRNGNRESLTYPNGTSTAYTYDDLNRLQTLTTTGPAGVVQSYAFTLGPSGNREHIDEADGTRRSYTYDDLYRLTGEAVTINRVFEYAKAFTYDDVGNRLTQVTSGSGSGGPGSPTAPASVAYEYDERDRLTLEGGRTHTWDANGNLTAKVGEATYAWDFENRLVRVETSTAIVEHAYDADGNRVQTKVTPATGPPTTTDYLVDTSGSLSHVVAEATAAGALQAYYARGDDLLAVMRPIVTVPGPATPTDWQSRFFHPDGIGSIRRLTDEAGQVTDTYTYTAFGELISHTGSDPQPYAFAGEPHDPNSGFQYHRARWMDAGTGRFSGSDLFVGLEYDPTTLHRYLYASANPANQVDPSGLFSSLFYGNRVHELIGMDFENSGPLRDWDLAISRIVGSRTPFFGRLRPDLIDFANKQIYEIKTTREVGIGQSQVQGYLLMLNWADPDKTRPWTAGTVQNYRPPLTLPVGLGAFAIITPPVAGVIGYDVFDLKPVVAALAAVAVLSMSTRGAELSGRFATAIIVVAFGGF